MRLNVRMRGDGTSEGTNVINADTGEVIENAYGVRYEEYTGGKVFIWLLLEGIEGELFYEVVPSGQNASRSNQDDQEQASGALERTS